jgi:hypothetical protein
MVKPQGRRGSVGFFQEAFRVSHRRARALSGISRSVVAYQPRRRDDGSLREATPLPTRANERWSIDFMAGTLKDERTFWRLRFLSLADAIRSIALGRLDDNRHRPHSALGGLMPEEFARRVA